MANRPYTYLIGWSKLDKWYYGELHILNNSLARRGQNDGRKWYNDGISEKFCREMPSKNWALGRIYKPRQRAKRVV